MASLSCWGEVTTENEPDVIAANRKLHPQQVKLLSVLTDILTSTKTEYWIDQGTLLGAYRHGKFIERDSDTDIVFAAPPLEMVMSPSALALTQYP